MPANDSQGSSGTELNQMVRIMRLGRLSKLVKLIKLIRILKFLKKDRQKSLSRDFMHMSVAFERLFFFVLISLLAIHLVSCLWLF